MVRRRQLFIKKISSLPAQALTTVLASLSDLEFLYLQGVTLSGDSNEFLSLAKCLSEHTSLKKIRMYKVQPAPTTRATFDPIITAFACMSALEEITLIHSKISNQPQDEEDDNNEGDNVNDNNDNQQDATDNQQQQWNGACLADLCR